ncbi:MAG: hypothetical protein WC156_09170 [Pedobacter sp.]
MGEKNFRWGSGALMTVALLLLSIGTGSAAVDKVICVPWQGDPVKQHTALSGVAAQLKGVIKTTDTSTVYYKWVFGDGSESTISTLSGSKKYNVATTHSYTAAMGTPFTAKLQVSNTNTNPFASVMENSYLLQIEDNTQDAQINIAIDKGLWWLYTNPAGSGTTTDGSPYTYWNQSSYANTNASPTASAIQAFAINNHKIKGDSNIDPYVEAVQQGMNFLTKGNALVGSVIGNPTYDRNNNGYGVQTISANPIYEGGQIMDAIISSGVLPGDSTGRSFSNTTHIWTYGELLQDLADMYTYYQHTVGAWGEYAFNSGQNDNSSSQWAAIGYIPAQAAPWNVDVPQFVKNQNKNWLTASFCNQGTTGYFGYQGGCGSYNDDALNTTGCGMVQMNFDGFIGYDDPSTVTDEREAKWILAEKFMADNWRTLLDTGSSSWGGNRTYGFYSFAKAMRLANPHPVETITKNNGVAFDWYRGGSSFSNDGNYNKGLAQRIVELQNSTGYWTGELTNNPLTTAWMIITLKPVLFSAAPISCFAASPNPSYANRDIAFNPSCSGHSESGKSIANLTKFEWDWNNDGTFDQSTTTPTVVQHQFSCASVPCVYPVKLRVTDDNNPALTATAVVEINITNPPHPPVANAGGPYVVTTCSNDSLILDGSKSFDQDEGQHETNCTTCSNDTITAWDWDLIAPLTFDVINKSGKVPSLTAADITSFFSVGSQNIGLRVSDNTALAFPGSGQPNLTNANFGSIDVKSGCLCELTASSKPGIVQLNWAAMETGATYNIWRSTDGPNTGFTKIRSAYTNQYPLFVNTGLTNGKTYYYRVEKVSANGNLCGSKAVKGTPKSLF